MRLFDRIGFSLAQKQLRESINNDGTFNSKKMQKALKRAGDGTTGFHIGGFALGFLLGLIVVLIAYALRMTRNPTEPVGLDWRRCCNTSLHFIVDLKP